MSAKEVLNRTTSIHSIFLPQLESWSFANVQAQDCPKTPRWMGGFCFSHLLPPFGSSHLLFLFAHGCPKSLSCFFPDFDPCQSVPTHLASWIPHASTFTLVLSLLMCVPGLAHNPSLHGLPCSFCPYSRQFWSLCHLCQLAFSVAPRHVDG